MASGDGDGLLKGDGDGDKVDRPRMNSKLKVAVEEKNSEGKRNKNERKKNLDHGDKVDRLRMNSKSKVAVEEKNTEGNLDVIQTYIRRSERKGLNLNLDGNDKEEQGIGIQAATNKEEIQTCLSLSAIQAATNKEEIQTCLSLSATKLAGNDMFAMCNPMAVVYKITDESLQEIGRTEVVLNTIEPEWIETISIPFRFPTLQPLLFKVFDIKQEYHDDLRGEVKLNLDEQNFLGKAKLFLSQIVTKSTSKIQLEGQGGLGTLNIHWEEKEFVHRGLRPSFLEYVSGGFEFKFIVAADFKVLNGDPRLPEFWRGRPLDPLAQVIHDIMEVIQFYGSHHIRFPDVISHSFDLHGLTDWESLMKEVTAIITKPCLRKEAKYFLLLIATDKLPTDEVFKKALLRSSDLPVSILVTGVEDLIYDAVQVPSQVGGMEVRPLLSKGSNAEALLKNVPEQMMMYLRRWRIKLQIPA